MNTADYRRLLREPSLFGGGSMKRTAIFVDAGYLFAAGSAAITGAKQKRQHLTLKKSATVEALIKVLNEQTIDSELLRIYWYDGADGYKGQTSEQTKLAYLDNIKLRLGFINSHGQQKGVDSLIVTDLIELARNRSIQDAILLSGDEDVRVGVQMAQSFGVRVHLIGIEPCRSSQSNLLMQEADTCTEWPKNEVSKILSHVSPEDLAKEVKAKSLEAAEQNGLSDEKLIEAVVSVYVKSLNEEKLEEAKSYIKVKNGIPPEHDGKMLGQCRDSINRNLYADEKRKYRTLARTIFLK